MNDTKKKRGPKPENTAAHKLHTWLRKRTAVGDARRSNKSVEFATKKALSEETGMAYKTLYYAIGVLERDGAIRLEQGAIGDRFRLRVEVLR